MSAPEYLVLSLVIPAVGALIVGLLGRWPNLREAATLLTATLLLGTVLQLLPYAQAGEHPNLTLATPFPGIPLILELEPLGMLFALVASALWLVTSIYSIGYMRGHDEPHQTRFYLFFALSLTSVMGVAFAGNLLTLFAFYELLTLATYPLVTHSGTAEARRAGRVYLGLLLGSSIGLQLLAIVWTWQLAGTVAFEDGGILTGRASAGVAGVLLALYVFGIGKAAVMPLHRWLPAAMVAPTPVSALLHAVAVVKAGVFSILKITVYIFGIDLLGELPATEWLAYAAATTIVLASLVAMTKDNLKARLAYSTVSQLSYIVLGAMLANAAGIIGGGLHMLTHAFGKITLFFCAGAIMVASHKTEISQMGGLGRQMPVTMFAFLIGSLSIIGLPPLGGLWSKWLLAVGTLEAGHQALLGVLMLSSLLNVAYLLPIPIRAFFGSPGPVGPQRIREAPMPTVLALVVTASGCVALFVFPDPAYRLLEGIVHHAP